MSLHLICLEAYTSRETIANLAQPLLSDTSLASSTTTHVVDQDLQMSVLFHVLFDDALASLVLHQITGNAETLSALGFDLLFDGLGATRIRERFTITMRSVCV